MIRFLTNILTSIYNIFANMLRKLISSPRNRHSDPLSSTSLDLAYLTPNLIVMSTPASTFPKNLWRNPTEDVRRFLNANHGDEWKIWSLRGEANDYLDRDLHDRGSYPPSHIPLLSILSCLRLLSVVEHFGWPDHHPPPFEYIQPLLTSIHNHLLSSDQATAILHCKGTPSPSTHKPNS